MESAGVSSYTTGRGALTGATLWRVVSEGTEQHVLPDGVMDLMWFDGRLVVAGPDTRAMIAATRAGDVTWGLQFAPGVAPTLLGVSARELTDQRVGLGDLVTLPPRLLGSPPNDAAESLERIVMALWTRADPEASTIRLAASIDRAARRGLRVHEIAERHHLSERSLRRVSDRLFGYGPKTLTSIHRLHHALRVARAGRSLGDAALAAGYADQAHLNREAKRLTGRTPVALLRLDDGRPTDG
ncbi:helix-turn-helix domain-containing protein [Nocardioides humi]|uniref:Helix-turn-helix transcriptional regulator n=1 Tax=Nocardioides humi TaxID=449461 RepID=A0ABN2BAB1_9ACTN|nr:AraC family transcriptional regulator [Nocardioides humi]